MPRPRTGFLSTTQPFPIHTRRRRGAALFPTRPGNGPKSPQDGAVHLDVDPTGRLGRLVLPVEICVGERPNHDAVHVTRRKGSDDSVLRLTIKVGEQLRECFVVNLFPPGDRGAETTHNRRYIRAAHPREEEEGRHERRARARVLTHLLRRVVPVAVRQERRASSGELRLAFVPEPLYGRLGVLDQVDGEHALAVRLALVVRVTRYCAPKYCPISAGGAWNWTSFSMSCQRPGPAARFATISKSST